MAPKNDVPAYVLGVGITKFIKPRQQRAYPEMGYEAGVKAMLDAQINYDDVETGVACYCYGDTTSGQRIFYQFGMSTYVLLLLIIFFLIDTLQYTNLQHEQCLRYRFHWSAACSHPNQEWRHRLCTCCWV